MNQPWMVKQQVLEDPATGLTFQFEVVEDDLDGPYRLRIFGDLPFGNREIIFGPEGNRVGTGTHTSGLCKPTWLTDLEEN